MNAELRRASDSYSVEPKNIVVNSIDDLKRIDDENENCGLILFFNKSSSGEDELSITIYDYYIE